jgi:hypothetical protein
MGLRHDDEVRCAPLAEDTILKIIGNQAEGANINAVPGIHMGVPAPGPAGPARQFFICDGQRFNNRALQPREQLPLILYGKSPFLDSRDRSVKHVSAAGTR